MEIETEVISTEIIRPSSPTPKSLQKHTLSFIDQIAPPFMAPTVYFYPPNPRIQDSQKTNHLKKSLSETLSTFYPLAGRLVGNLHVDCNDQGVPFAVAAANCRLSHVTTNPDINKIKERLVYNMSDQSQFFFLAVQVTHFRCGGFSVGILISHKIFDALSMVKFAGAWSAAARGGGSGAPPKFDCAAYFLPQDDIRSIDVTEEDVVTKNFTFSAAKIDLLREIYGGGGRVEVLTAYICTRLASAKGFRPDSNKSYFLNQPINLRTRVDPPKLKDHFGNVSWNAVAALTAGDGGVEVLRKLREARKAFYEGYVPQLGDLDVINMARIDESDRVVSFSISSMCGFPLYEADFGWGKPDWVVFAGVPLRNVAIFTDKRSGGGIEVVINLSKEDMDNFEVRLELPVFKSNL